MARQNTAVKKKLFLEAFEKSACNISMACRAAKMSRSKFYEWIAKDKKFAQCCDELDEGLADIAESQLHKNILKGKETSLIFYLTNRRPDRWKHLKAFDMTSNGEKIGTIEKVQVEIIKGGTEDTSN